MPKERTIYVLKADNTIIIISPFLKTIYDCVKTKVPEEYRMYLKSYVQYSRYLNKHAKILIPIPYSVPLFVEKHILRNKFRKINLQTKEVRKSIASLEHNSSAEVQLRG